MRHGFVNKRNHNVNADGFSAGALKPSGYKQSLGKFVFSEFVIFVSQVAVFFMVVVFTTIGTSNIT